LPYSRFDFIDEKHLRKSDKFLNFLSFGFYLDDRRSKEAISCLLSAKQSAPDIFKADWLTATPTERFEAMDSALNQIIRDEITTIEPNQNVVMGLSGGFDSRLILHYLRRNGIEPKTYTFARKFDAAVARALADRLPIEQFSLPSSTPCFDDLYSLARREQDLLFLRRLTAIEKIEKAFPSRVEFHGLGGGAVSQVRTKLSENVEWNKARKRFSRANDPFELASRIGGTKFLPRKPFVADQELLFEDQLRFAYRMELRIRPHRDNSDNIYRYPLFDSRWIGVWLNRSIEERYDQALLIAFIRWLDAPEFFDIAGSTVATGPEARLFLSNQYPSTEIENQDRSARTLADVAAKRLRKRGVFSNAFLESQIARIPNSKTARQVLICTELAIGADWFA